MDNLWKEFEEYVNLNGNSLKHTTIQEDKIDTTHITKKCCDNKIIDYKQYENICMSCGVILSKNFISEEQEWSINNEGQFTRDIYSDVRCETLPKSDIFIEYSNRTFISGNKKLSTLHNIATRNNISYDEQFLLKTKYLLDNILNQEDIPRLNIVENTLRFLKIIRKNKDKIYRGNNSKGVLAVCFYYACKEGGYDIIQEKVIKLFSITSKVFNKCYKYCMDILNKIGIQDSISILSSNVDISQSINRICVELGISDFKIIKTIKQIIKSSERLNLVVEFCSQSIISGCIYFTIKELKNETIDKKKISSILKISVASIIKVNKILEKNKIEIFNHIKHNKY